MKFEKLGNIVTISSGGTPLTSKREYYNNGTIPWVKTGDLKVRHLINIPDKITQLGLENSSAKLFPVNSVLIAMYGATIGACAILKTKAATNQACAALLPNEKVNHEFLYFYLLSIREKLVKKGVGGGQPNISATILKSVKIPIFSIEEQVKIATILGNVEALIKQRKESIELLDVYLKSTFLKMFGDPVNGNIYPRSEFKKICTVRQGLQIPISERKTEAGLNRYPYITNQFVNGGKIGEFIENPKPSVICKIDDVLMTRTGNTGIVVTDIAGVFHNNFFLIDYERELIDKKYLVTYLKLPQIKSIILKKASTTTIPDLNHGDFYKVTIPLPPIEIQKRFSNIVVKLELLKIGYKKSLQELENLFASLNQKAFKGELDLSKVKVLYEEQYSSIDNDKNEPKHFEKSVDAKTIIVKAKLHKFYGGGEALIAPQWLANQIIEKYAGKYFSFEMLMNFLKKEKLSDTIKYFSSEEIKSNPKYDETEDIKIFLETAVANIEMDVKQKEKVNPWLKLNQHFYNANTENITLTLTKEDFELIKNRTAEERSGIYFNIAQ